jgi:biopolymer transport protein TolR
MRAMKSAEEGNQPLSEINVTPFVDVMLVLLIIFMVTAPLLQYGVEVDLPESSREPLEIPKEQVVLSIAKDRTIYVDRYKTSLSELRQKLEAIYKGKQKKEIFLQADKSVPYGFVVQTMAVIRAAGIDQMGLITESPD